MATSSAMNTSNQFIKYTITVKQNSQSITNNTSNVTVSVRFYRTNTGYKSWGTGTVYCKINGTTYEADVTPDDEITHSGIVLFTKTLNISHNTDGSKKLTCSAWISHDVVTSSEQSYSQTLTTIPRKSSLSVANGTLGTEQTLKVTRQSTNFTHTIVATCGDQSKTVCTKSTDESIEFTPPLDFAKENTTGTSVNVKYTITTYNGSTSVGSNSYTVSCSIPSSVKPTVTVNVSDPEGYNDTYGGYVQGKSKLNIVISASGSYGSTIKAYKTTADGKTYTSASVTTDIIAGNGSLKISVTVTDSRGRTAATSKTVTVLAYDYPKITSLNVKRCDSQGNDNKSGEYLAVVFSSEVAALNSKNTASYSVKYKKANETAYTTNTLSDFAGDHSVSNGIFVFAAETKSSYDIVLTVTDAFKCVEKTAYGSSIKKLFSYLKKGFGFAIGKIAEIENLFDVDLPARFRQGVTIDSEWIDLTLDDDFSLYNGLAENQPRYKSRAGIVTIKGCVSPATQFTSTNDAFTIASGIPPELRPSEHLQFVCQGSEMNRWNFAVRTDGKIAISRYGVTENTTVPTTARLSFCVTYQV